MINIVVYSQEKVTPLPFSQDINDRIYSYFCMIGATIKYVMDLDVHDSLGGLASPMIPGLLVRIHARRGSF